MSKFSAGSISLRRSHFLVLAMFLANTSLNAAEHPAGGPKAIHALCTAANAILASQGEGGLLDEIVRHETRRHADAARALGATNEDLSQIIEAMRQEYNAGKLSWDEIAELGYRCTELESP